MWEPQRNQTQYSNTRKIKESVLRNHLINITSIDAMGAGGDFKVMVNLIIMNYVAKDV